MSLNMKDVDFKIWVLLGVLLIILGTNVWQLVRETKFAMVDAQYIVNTEAQKLAKLYPKGNVPELKLQQLVNRLRSVVEDYAEKNKVIVIAKGALMGGVLPDYTEVILEKLKKTDENP